MRTGLSGKRAFKPIGCVPVGPNPGKIKGSWLASQIIIRCKVLRGGFGLPALIFLKSRGPRVLNRTTRIQISRIFNHYFKNHSDVNPIALQLIIKKTWGSEKQIKLWGTSPLLPAVPLPQPKEVRSIQADRLRRLISVFILPGQTFGGSGKTIGTPGSGLFFPKMREILSTHFRKADSNTREVPQKQFIYSFRSGSPGVIESREQIKSISNLKSALAIIAELKGRHRSESTLFRIQEPYRSVSDDGLQFREGTGSDQSQSSRTGRPVHSARILSKVVESLSIQNGIPVDQSSPLTPYLTALPYRESQDRPSIRNRIARLSSSIYHEAVFVRTSEKPFGFPGIPKTGDEQTGRPAPRIPERTPRLVARMVLNPDQGDAKITARSRVSKIPIPRGLEALPDRKNKEVFSRSGPEPNQAGSILRTIEAGHPQTIFSEAQRGNNPLRISAKDWAEKADRKRDLPYPRPSSGPMHEKYTWPGLQHHLLRQGMAEADIESSRPLVPVPKIVNRNSAFLSRMIVQSHSILNRIRHESIISSPFWQGPDAQNQGMQRAPMTMDSIAAFRNGTYVGLSGNGVEKSSPAGIFGDMRIIREDKLNHTTPGFPDVVYQKKQSSTPASFPGLHKAGDPEAPRLMGPAPELVLKKEGLRSPQEPVSQEQKESAVAANAVHTIYEYDDKKHKTREINVIADRVYKILEKRIAVERDRRGII